MTIIPKLTPTDVTEEVLRMTNLSIEEYSQHVNSCGIEFAKTVVAEFVHHKPTAERFLDELLQQQFFWLFFKNQVFLQSLQFVHNWYAYDLTENTYNMHRKTWMNSIRPIRIIARPAIRNLKAALESILINAKQAA
jgi:hypothetical protein